MGKPVNLVSTAHSQAKEFAAIAGVASNPADQSAQVADLKNQVRGLTESLNSTISELAAEKEAHEKTQAALTAATSTGS
jgi:cell division septum initiation protein DivIVA